MAANWISAPKRTHRVLGLVGVVLGLVLVGVGLAPNDDAEAKGNETCADVLGPDFAGKEYKNDPPSDVTVDGITFAYSEDMTVVTVTSDGTYTIFAIIIKGSTASTVVTTAPFTGSPPTNPGENTPQISNTTVCYGTPPPTTSSTSSSTSSSTTSTSTTTSTTTTTSTVPTSTSSTSTSTSVASAAGTTTTVVAAGPTTTAVDQAAPTTTVARTLPPTGSDTSRNVTLVLLGALLVVVGGTLIWLGRPTA